MNTNLHLAKKAKNDEFYTKLSDIENEIKHYDGYFKDKVVFCNCNDTLKSNFTKYFTVNFNKLGLKKLICTAYKADGVHGMVYIYEKNRECKTHMLEGDGGFGCDECLEFLEESDVVVTNPPFSLFREYVTLLMNYNKQFLIIGNMNAITYKEIFPLIKENKMWLGISLNGTKCSFIVNEDYEGKNTFYEDGVKYGKVNNAIWFTNIDHKKRHEEIPLHNKYDENLYPKYDNYNAIEVGKIVNIPYDYNGIVGVPITFLTKYNPKQFEIIKFRKGDDDKDLCVNGKCPYFRILIRKK